MRRHRTAGIFLSCLALLWIAGCEKSVEPEAGDWTVRVTVWMYDEFGRQIPTAAPFNLTLSAQDRVLHAVMNDASAPYSFTGLPYQPYLVTVEKGGYYTAQGAPVRYESQYDKFIDIDASLYPVPGPDVRIDSIRCTVNDVVPQFAVTLFSPQVLPAVAYKQAVIFAGLAPDVSPRYGTYVSSFEVAQSTGTSTFQTENVYGNLSSIGIPPGTKIYLTARIKTGATASRRDEKTGLTIYENLEETTRAVASFIMP